MDKHRYNQDGFSLIELMIVVAILGILVSIAVPTLLSAQGGSKVAAAKSNVRTALSAVKTLPVEHQAYWVDSDATTLGLLEAAEPSLAWVATMGSASGGANEVSWASTPTEIVIAVRSSTDECFFIRDNTAASSANAGTSFGKTVVTAATTCHAAVVPVWRTSQAAGWPKTGASA